MQPILFALMLVAATNAAAPAPCNREVTIIDAVAPDFSGSGHATILVTVSPQGTPISATIQSATSAAMAKATAQAAIHSKYAPKMVNCKAVAGTYQFHVEATPQ